ncbi:MAG: hypothetical protein R3242_11285, partial [Akkermansiaceae bacterium]|nr:hypothetical protein [Akkermansiaceae bacterium]
LVYFSRMFIHESLLVLSGAALMGVCMAFPRWGLPGVLLGLMFAAKESFAISVLAWAAAIGVLLIQERRALSAEAIRQWLAKHGKGLVTSAATAAFTALICYTHGFTHLQGAVDMVKTYFVYDTVEGHDKSWDYYLQLLALPEKSAGVWWYGTPVVMLALYAYALSWTRCVERNQRRWIQLLAHSALAHLVIYSLFAYKTPWLACFPWALICWLAGMAFVNFSRQLRWVQLVLLLFLTATLWTQFKQTRLACERLHSDARNPYAYVPTRPDLERMEEWLDKLRAMEGGEPLDRAAVIGTGYWPLPWYLRKFDQVGYWQQAPEDLESYPLVLMMPEPNAALGGRLDETHVPLPHGLRDGVPLQMYLSRAIWDQWMNTP